MKTAKLIQRSTVFLLALSFLISSNYCLSEEMVSDPKHEQNQNDSSHNHHNHSHSQPEPDQSSDCCDSTPLSNLSKPLTKDSYFKLKLLELYTKFPLLFTGSQLTILSIEDAQLIPNPPDFAKNLFLTSLSISSNAPPLVPA